MALPPLAVWMGGWVSGWMRGGGGGEGGTEKKKINSIPGTDGDERETDEPG
jgi:hypothetical protein